jgi:serine/threonine-protein kinase
MIQLTDAVDYCDIYLRDRQELLLIKFYFNDESHLAFGIPQTDGVEESYPINTLRGLSVKKKAILARWEILLVKTNTAIKRQKTAPQPSFNS